MSFMNGSEAKQTRGYKRGEPKSDKLTGKGLLYGDPPQEVAHTVEVAPGNERTLQFKLPGDGAWPPDQKRPRESDYINDPDIGKNENDNDQEKTRKRNERRARVVRAIDERQRKVFERIVALLIDKEMVVDHGDDKRVPYEIKTEGDESELVRALYDKFH